MTAFVSLAFGGERFSSFPETWSDNLECDRFRALASLGEGDDTDTDDRGGVIMLVEVVIGGIWDWITASLEIRLVISLRYVGWSLLR